MTPIEKIVQHMKESALTGTYTGLVKTPRDELYVRNCMMSLPHQGIGLMFTRDENHHESGWWKNPDYERCLHLSVSFFDPITRQAAPFNKAHAKRLARLFFGHHLNLVWVEPPYSPEGKLRGVHHYRLFCDAGWQPIKPRGEVYSTQYTPPHWRSFSEIHGDKAKHFEPPIGVA